MNKLNKDKSFQTNPYWVALIMLISAFALYGNTLWNKYCLDDSLVITRNTFTQQGLAGIPDIFSNESFTGFFGKQKELVSGARYRPLSIATFAIEQELFNRTPAVSHFINILLFAITGFLIYKLLTNVFKSSDSLHPLIPLIAALLFIFHPIHTEVVANIKGRDELMALLFSLSGCYAVLRYLETSKTWLLLSGTLLWFLGLLSKENAIIWWFLLPVLISMKGIKDNRKYLRPVITFSMAAFLFLLIRHAVIGSSTGVSDELMNNSYLEATSSQKFATIFYTLWRYIELLFLPWPLTYDYYPYHVSLAEWGSVRVILGMIAYVSLFTWLVVSVRKHRLIFFALIVYLLPLLLVCNLFFPIGTFMSERFLYFSSLGFCILLALGFSYVIQIGPKLKTALFTLAGILFVLATIEIVSRNKAWYNDYTLFTTDVKTSVNSAKSNCSAGGVLLESTDTIADLSRKSAAMRQSISYLQKSVAIHPKYFDAWLLLGNAYFKQNKGIDSVVYCYSNILNLNPMHELAFENMQALANRENNPDSKISVLLKMLVYQPNNYLVNYQLGRIYGKDKVDIDKSLSYLNKALAINSKEKDLNLDLGVAYGFKSDFAKSAQMLEKALQIDPNDKNILINLGVTYKNLGQLAKADECFKKAESLSKSKQ